MTSTAPTFTAEDALEEQFSCEDHFLASLPPRGIDPPAAAAVVVVVSDGVLVEFLADVSTADDPFSINQAVA